MNLVPIFSVPAATIVISSAVLWD